MRTLATPICWCTYDEQNSVYKIWPQQYSVPGFTYRARSGKSTYYRLETFLLEGSQG
ncbi:hypothetical protein MJ575_08485 [Klebsiella pneumoniae]|nr:hypothetical protein MJ575_08485 [Klebsiella pneumoniae]